MRRRALLLALVAHCGAASAVRAQGGGEGIYTVVEPLDYRFPDGTWAFLRSFRPPLVDRGQVFFRASEGSLLSTWILFLYSRGELINLMDTSGTIPGTDPPVWITTLRSESFRDGIGLGYASNDIDQRRESGLYLLRPSREPEVIVDTLPAEPGGDPELRTFFGATFVGDDVVFLGVDGEGTVNHFRFADGDVTPLLPTSGLMVEGMPIRRVGEPLAADDTRYIAIADLEETGDAAVVTIDLDGTIEGLALPGDPIPGIGQTIDRVSNQGHAISGANYVTNVIWRTESEFNHTLMGTLEGRPEEPQVFVKTGDPVPDSPGTTFWSFVAVSVVGDSFVFLASILDDTASKLGLYKWEAGDILPIYDNRQMIGGNSVSTIDMDPEAYDGNFLAFRGHLGGGRDAIYMSRVRPWPANIDDWKEEAFTSEELGDERISGDEANPDGDMFSNLMEYVTGCDPKRHERLSPPRIEEGRVLFDYPLAYGVEDYALAAEFTAGLTGWADDVEVVATAELPTHKIVTVRALPPAAEVAEGFFRIVARRIGASP